MYVVNEESYVIAESADDPGETMNAAESEDNAGETLCIPQRVRNNGVTRRRYKHAPGT